MRHNLGTEDRAVRLTPIYSGALRPSLQALLSALADIDFGYERALEELSCGSIPDLGREQVAQMLQEQHRRDRAQYIQCLEELQTQLLWRA